MVAAVVDLIAESNGVTLPYSAHNSAGVTHGSIHVRVELSDARPVGWEGVAGMWVWQGCAHSHGEAAEAMEDLQDVSKPIHLDQVAIDLVKQKASA